ncbi:MAG: PLxRFG domain-containing protein, partial [Inhella sp.]
TLAHTGVLAGVVGLPGFAAAAFIINKLADAFGDDDEPYNLENELRKMLGGGDFARLVMRGAPTLAGADLSGKLGMGNALSILPYTDFDASREGFNAIAVGLTLGATGGLGARVFQGLGDIKDGDYYRGLMGLAPIGVSQAMKAFVEAYQGETNRRGDVLVSADEIGTFETFAKAIGFPTSAGAERRFDRQIAFDNKEAFESKASKIKNEYSRAVRANDSDARRTAIEKWQRLQASRKEAGFKPQPLSTLMKAPQEQAKRERNTSGGVQFNTQNRQFVQEQTAN